MDAEGFRGKIKSNAEEKPANEFSLGLERTSMSQKNGEKIKKKGSWGGKKVGVGSLTKNEGLGSHNHHLSVGVGWSEKEVDIR